MPKYETFTKVRGAVGVRPKGSSLPPMLFHRDYAYAMPMIFKNATILTELSITEDTQGGDVLRERLESLDTISQFYIRMWEDCRTNNIIGISGWREILKYLNAEDAEKTIRAEVFGTFNSFVALSLFVYMFAAKEMAISSPESFDEICYNTENLLSLLSIMSTEDRKCMLKEIRKLGLMDSQINLLALYKQGSDYLKEIRKDQEQRYGKIAESPETD